MKKIYTEKETIRFIPLYLLIPVILVTIYGFSEYGFGKISFMHIGCALIIWLLVGVLFFFIWFLNEYKLICAKRQGEVYIGTVKSVRIKGEKRYGVHSRKYAYVIILSIIVNEQEHIIESENFYSDPSKYITTGDKIKVFYYNNKFYPEFVYEKNKKHKQSKNRTRRIRLTVQPFEVKCNEEMKYVLILVTIKSLKMYNNSDFLIKETIEECCLDGKDFANPEELKEKIVCIVKQVICQKDESIEIQELNVMVK